jgi:hypothetical protein
MSHGYSPSETDTNYLGSQARKNKGTINGYINNGTLMKKTDFIQRNIYYSYSGSKSKS